ncbi:Eukaryotic translation initiation factor 3 subunit E, partial [Halocaridina rubra]
MTPKDAERWIVNLIRQAKLDAKIDSQQGHVVMGTQAVSPYQQLIEKTKTLSFRTQMLAINVEKKATARYNEVSKPDSEDPYADKKEISLNPDDYTPYLDILYVLENIGKEDFFKKEDEPCQGTPKYHP